MLNLEVNVVIIPYRYAVVGVHPGPGRAVKIDQKNIFPHDQKDDIMLLKLPNAITDVEPVALPTCKDKNNNLNKKPEEWVKVILILLNLKSYIYDVWWMLEKYKYGIQTEAVKWNL